MCKALYRGAWHLRRDTLNNKSAAWNTLREYSRSAASIVRQKIMQFDYSGKGVGAIPSDGIWDEDAAPVVGIASFEPCVSDCVILFENARYGIKNTFTIGTNNKSTSQGFLPVAFINLTIMIIINTTLTPGTNRRTNVHAANPEALIIGKHWSTGIQMSMPGSVPAFSHMSLKQ